MKTDIFRKILHLETLKRAKEYNDVQTKPDIMLLQLGRLLKKFDVDYKYYRKTKNLTINDTHNLFKHSGNHYFPNISIHLCDDNYVRIHHVPRNAFNYYIEAYSLPSLLHKLEKFKIIDTKIYNKYMIEFKKATFKKEEYFELRKAS
jgi:hypothetical protein